MDAMGKGQRMGQPFGSYQNEIYFDGLSGELPRFPMGFAELEASAQAAMPPSVRSYVAGGAGDERTQRANVAAFDGWGLVPRMFVGAAERDLSVELFGMSLPSPVFMAPVGVIGLCSQDGHGDLATARAAARTGVPMIASTLSVDPMEQVAAELGDTPGLFQLYTPTDRELAASLVHRAEQAGYKGIVVTLDTWITGWRPRDLATGNFPSCAATAWPTTSAIRSSGPRWRPRPRRIRSPRSCAGSRSSATRSPGTTCPGSAP